MKIISRLILIILIQILVIGIIGFGLPVYLENFQVKAWDVFNADNGALLMIYFNQPMIRSTVEKNLTVNPEIKVKFQWRDYNRQLTIIPSTALSSDEYEITINHGRSFAGTKIDKKTLSFIVNQPKQKKIMLSKLPLTDYIQKKIDIDISSQKMQLWENSKITGEYVVSTGKPATPTKIGNFEVISKHLMAYGCGEGQCWMMPFWLGFYRVGSQENGIHELPFINGIKESNRNLGYRVSHGCVRLDVGVAEKVYHWADIGTPVIVHS